jgi:hypothetical protein
MQVRTRDTHRQARTLRLESAPPLFALVDRAALTSVGIAPPDHPHSRSQTSNRLDAARGRPDITHTGHPGIRPRSIQDHRLATRPNITVIHCAVDRAGHWSTPRAARRRSSS